MRILISFLTACILFTVSPLLSLADSKPLDWQMRYGDEGNMNYSPVSLPLNLELKQDPIENASSMFAVNQGQLYSTDRIENKQLSLQSLIFVKKLPHCSFLSAPCCYVLYIQRYLH
jgi:hypothetical protein